MIKRKRPDTDEDMPMTGCKIEDNNDDTISSENDDNDDISSSNDTVVPIVKFASPQKSTMRSAYIPTPPPIPPRNHRRSSNTNNANTEFASFVSVNTEVVIEKPTCHRRQQNFRPHHHSKHESLW